MPSVEHRVVRSFSCYPVGIALALFERGAGRVSSLGPAPLGQRLAASCRESLALFKSERPNTDVGAR
jgi:hypothetical protein